MNKVFPGTHTHLLTVLVLLITSSVMHLYAVCLNSVMCTGVWTGGKDWMGSVGSQTMCRVSYRTTRKLAQTVEAW